MSSHAENELPEYLPPEILDSIPTLQAACDGKIHRFRCFSAGFINEWRKEKNVLSTEELAVKASSYLFYEQNRATSWQSESYLNFPKEYRYYGLEALSDLFGVVVVRKHLRAKPRVAFNRSCFVLPNGICCESEKVCSFADWEKAFWLAAFEFGLVKHGDPASDRGINILLQRYGLKPDDTFLQDLAKLKHQPNRWKNREFLNRFAMAWDIFILPLRFFTDESARDFALEYLGLNGEDISNYRKLIHRGGAKRQDGLRLVSEKPPIVTEWKLTITLSKSGAKRHVFPVEPAVEFLRKFSGRQAIAI
jgi:hypothetical protein